MQRRDVLGRCCAAVGTLALAGCSGLTGDGSGTSDGSGGSTPTAVPPRGSFTFELESRGSDRGLLTVTRQSGDVIPADELYVRGESFADVDEAEMTESGSWAGSASGSADGGSAVVSGDSVSVGVRMDYEVRVVWEASDADKSMPLGTDRGPDA